MPHSRFVTIEGKKLSSQHWAAFQASAASIQLEDGYDNNSLLNMIESIKSNPMYKLVSVAWLFSYYRRNYELAFPNLNHRQLLVYAAIDVKNTLDKILNHTPDTEN